MFGTRRRPKAYSPAELVMMIQTLDRLIAHLEAGSDSPALRYHQRLARRFRHRLARALAHHHARAVG